MRRFVDGIGDGKLNTPINILHSMRMADYAWRSVTEITVRNRSNKARLKM